MSETSTPAGATDAPAAADSPVADVTLSDILAAIHDLGARIDKLEAPAAPVAQTAAAPEVHERIFDRLGLILRRLS